MPEILPIVHFGRPAELYDRPNVNTMDPTRGAQEQRSVFTPRRVPEVFTPQTLRWLFFSLRFFLPSLPPDDAWLNLLEVLSFFFLLDVEA